MDKYLLDILKESNTIIIPGLGALTITNKETGETMFMPYLQHDDGRFAAFIAEKDGIDESDAKIMVAKYVREIQAELGKGESYSMFELGTFVKANDGDIEFTHWSNLKAKEEEVSVAPVLEETVIADEPIVEPEPELKEIATPEFDADEIEIKNTIEEALENTSEPEVTPIIEAIETPEIPKEIIPEVAPEPVVEKITSAAAAASLGGLSVPEDEIIDSELPKEQAVGLGEEQKAKDKPTPKFWITMIVIALLIIAGGAYIGRNYQELKQHIPFLADAKEDVESLKDKGAESSDEVDRTYKGGTSTEDGADDTEDNSAEEEIEEATTAEPDPIVEQEPISTPIVASSSGPYHIVAGAFSSVDNANRLAENFKTQGLPATVIKNGSLNAVSMQSYATSEQAKADLNKMNSIASGAWILYKQ
ncbi:MAG: SPOR domain-containing protein [Crocinitomicaceae bacterium]|nr:SPOR domain-containing protein [Flavobacteriales bacterium]NQZ37468.1 SPOR domain-containing protein [Crocinitomicaceae bacterium]